MDLLFTGIIDLVIVAIVIGTIIYGYKKGFVEQFISIISHFVGITFSILFAKPLANIIKKLSLGVNIRQKIDTYFISKSPEISEIFISTDEALMENIQKLGFPKFINNFLFDSLKDLFGVDNVKQTLLDVISPFCTSIILLIISFLILLFGSKILFLIIRLLVKYFKNIKLIEIIDSVFGVFISIIKFYIFITIIFALLHLFLEIPSIYQEIYPFLEIDMQLSTDKFRISKYFYEHNLIINFIKIFF